MFLLSHTMPMVRFLSWQSWKGMEARNYSYVFLALLRIERELHARLNRNRWKDSSPGVWWITRRRITDNVGLLIILRCNILISNIKSWRIKDDRWILFCLSIRLCNRLWIPWITRSKMEGNISKKFLHFFLPPLSPILHGFRKICNLWSKIHLAIRATE